MVDPLKILWVLTNSTYLVSKFLRNSESSEDAPFFEHALYEAEVRESEDVKHHVITITAENHDDDTYIRYEIAGGNVGDVFTMDPDTGAVSLSKPLDYESRKQYSLELSVTDGESVSYATLVVRVLDVNDNPPVFEKNSYRTQVTEEDDRNLPKRILQVNVTDADRDRPRDVVYFLTGPGVDADEPSSAQFTINSTSGEIYVLKPLDRDLPHGRPQWRFTVFAQDEGGQGLVGYADIQVNLKDVNDNPPVFTENLAFANVTENGTAGQTVILMEAIDYDDPEEGGNAQLTYNIEKNALDEHTGAAIFSVDPRTGEVRTAVCCLDREKTPDYTLQIVAVDGGGLKGTGTVSIVVSDINDMPPVFTKEEWLTEVNESSHTPQAAILTVTVIDRDETNDFYYKVVEGSGFGTDKFSMVRNPDGTGSLRVVRPLDYEDLRQRNGFRFKIQVNDQGPNATDDSYHTAHSWVVVRLKDINDNPPRLDKAEARVSLKEDVRPGTLVETFTARDPDQGGEGRVVFSMLKGSDPRRHFKVSPEGRVTVLRPLDRETTPMHKVLLTATDEGDPPLTSTATLTVTVVDVNDNAPQLLKHYNPVLTEHSAARVVVELFASDADDHSAGHGPPYNFSLDPSATGMDKLFRVETNPKGDNGRGIAVVSSLVSLDREHQKEYLLPIMISDSGKPPMFGTSTLTITVGDINDNPMTSGSYQITVYKLEGREEDMLVGRVYVTDLDDWDLPDKTFKWASNPLEHFRLDTDTGELTMAGDTPEASYRMLFRVRDHRHGENVQSDVTIRVRTLSRLALANSQSFTLQGVSDIQFISSSNSTSSSPLVTFRETLAKLVNTTYEHVEVFSVQTRRQSPLQLTDVRFSVRDHSQYFKPVRLRVLLLINRPTIERSLGASITAVGPDQCLEEGSQCSHNCSPRLTVPSGGPGYLMGHRVEANSTGLAGPHLLYSAECVCGARNFRSPETCQTTPCLNHGTCTETQYGPICTCRPEYDGPRCQQTSRGFRGTGWAWYPGLQVCEDSHLSLEFITAVGEGVLLYNGPIAPPNPNRELVPDFISLELVDGAVQLLINFGSGTVNLTLQALVNDGEWHRVDVLWNSEEVRLLLDLCKYHPHDPSDHDWVPEDSSSCLASSALPLFSTQLNLDSPLQLGGAHTVGMEPAQYGWGAEPTLTGFHGCLRNLIINGEIMDLGSPALSQASVAGCPLTAPRCSDACSPWSSCDASLYATRCRCHPGYSGLSCSSPTTPSTLVAGGLIKYALAFQPDPFHGNLQMRFRTRESGGELFRLLDQHHKEYIILEISNSILQVRFNLDNTKPQERLISLPYARIDDGRWHVVKMSRYGSAIVLQLDGGEGRRYNETFSFQGHQLLSVDKQEGVFAGGPTQHVGGKDSLVVASFQDGCLDDIRLDGRHLPLPPGSNGSQWGQAPVFRGVESHCQSSSVCSEVKCPETFVCQDIWNDYVCTCGPGHLATVDGKACTVRSDCMSAPCQNGGLCVESGPGQRYRCVCPDSYTGQRCELVQERQTLKLGVGALCTIVGCLLLILLLVVLFVAYTRRRETHLKKPPEDDVRENIIRYQDEGGGEEDLNAVDLLPLKVPGQEANSDSRIKLKVPELIEETSLDVRLEGCRRRLEFELSPPPIDNLRNYAFEGACDSITGSLSSLDSETENEESVRCVVLGPQFHKLIEIYTSLPGPSLQDSI